MIEALCKYYDILKRNSSITPDGYDEQEVSFIIYITPDGKISDIANYRKEEEKTDKKGNVKTELVPNKIVLPKRSQKTAINSNFIEHRPLYIFGLNLDKNEFKTNDDKNKAKNSHNSFVEYNLKMIEGINSEIVNAYRNFILNWKPENETQNKSLLKIAPYYNKPKTYYCFALDGHPNIMLHNDEGMLKRWDMELNNMSEVDDDSDNGFCAVTGKVDKIARIHNKTKAILGGVSTGSVLIGVNKEAEESYCKKQAYNNNISIEAMEKYTTALNYLLDNNSHHTVMEGITLVYWAMSDNDTNEVDILNYMLGKSMDKARSDKVDNFIKGLISHTKRGLKTDIDNFHIDEDVEFYIVGLTPNSSRVSVKLLLKNHFGKILENITIHQKDMFLEDGKGNISINTILRQLISPKSTKSSVPSPLSSAIINSIIMGGQYPTGLLETVIRRVKIDNDDEDKKNVKLNIIRAGIIKACINRKSRINNKKEEIKMALDLTNANEAYLCGRLFSVLENIQYASSTGKLNRTIKDAYFSTACAKPALVFPKLIKLSQYHINKLEVGGQINYDKAITEIVSKLNQSFPSVLSLEEQGKFILGYYQERESYFKRLENSKNSQKKDSEEVKL